MKTLQERVVGKALWITIDVMDNKLLAAEIEQLLDNELRPFCTKKTGKKWLFSSAETICRLTLIRDRSKPYQFYLDIDVSLIELNSTDAFNEPVWHIIGRFYPCLEGKIEWERCLDIRHEVVSGKNRQARLVEIVREKIVPLVHSFETLDGIKKLLFSNQLRAMGIRTELQKLTGYKT